MVPVQLALFVHAGGKVAEGLVRRRPAGALCRTSDAMILNRLYGRTPPHNNLIFAKLSAMKVARLSILLNLIAAFSVLFTIPLFAQVVVDPALTGDK